MTSIAHRKCGRSQIGSTVGSYQPGNDVVGGERERELESVRVCVDVVFMKEGSLDA